MRGHTLDWEGSEKVLLEEGRFEHPEELGRPPGPTPARANRYWTEENARRLWRAVLVRMSKEGGVPEGARHGRSASGRCAGTRPETVQQVALRCTGLPGMDRLKTNEGTQRAVDALMAHCAKGQSKGTNTGACG